MNGLGILLVFIIAIAGIAGFGLWWRTTPKATGVCIFKGPFTFGGLFSSSSDGIPLRDIFVNASVWNPVEVARFQLVAQGSTDRLGCFSFQGESGVQYELDYQYQGHGYSDWVSPGVILRDNLP